MFLRATGFTFWYVSTLVGEGMILSHRRIAGAWLILSVVSTSGIRAQGPGDTQPLKAVHPGYTLINLRPAALQEGIGGMDFLSDGRLAVCTWGGNHDPVMAPVRNGNLYILSGVELDDPAKVTYRKFASNLQEPLGLKVVNDTLYVSERMALVMLLDNNKDGVADSGTGYRNVAAYASGDGRHEYFFGLPFNPAENSFYGAHSISLNNGGTAAVPQPHADRGTFVKINRSTGKTEYIAGGARQPFGLNFGPEGDLFATDVQGTWMPANKLNHVKPDRFYGHYQKRQVPANPWDAKAYQPPAVYLSQSEIANAPGQPLLVDKGVFAGQMLYGDVFYGGIQRVFLEKVKGEWQGAVFRFSAGFEGGVGRLVWGPDGALYVGQVGHATGNWFEPNKKTYGLAKLKQNGKTAFEMLRVISRAKGMEIEFTEPVGDSAEVSAKYKVQTFYFTPDSIYGGSKQGTRTLVPKSAKLDPTGRKVFLEIDGLETGRVVYIRLLGLKSKEGKAPWSTEAWYTLNNVGSGNAFDPVGLAAPAAGRSERLFLSQGPGNISVTLPRRGPFELRLLDLRGMVRSSWSGSGGAGESVSLSTAGLPRGLYAVSLRGPGMDLGRKVLLP